MKIILLNGPPGSGKDTLAQAIQDCNPGYTHLTFKEKLIELTLVIYSLNIDKQWLFSDRVTKDAPTPLFKGLTPRQALIKVSEQVIKPNFGSDYFAKALVTKIENIERNTCGKDSNIVVSDLGFQSEIDSIQKNLLSYVTIEVVHLIRKNYSFQSDSRSYIYSDNYIKQTTFINDGSIQVLKIFAEHLVS